MARRRVRRQFLFLAALAVLPLGLVAAVGDAAYAATAQGPVRGAGTPGAVADSYLVVLKDTRLGTAGVRVSAAALTRRYGGTVHQAFGATLHGFAARMTATEAGRVAADPAVAYVQQDHRVSLAGTQTNPPSWGLDRIDQPSLPLDNSYTYPSTAATVHAYIVDTGIRISHQDFGGRASYGYDFIDNDAVADDCMGHGTHVAGTVGGATYGVAKQVQLVAVRVLDCSGSGTYSQIVAGIDWVTAHAVKPAVVNMSLGGSADSFLDDAVAASIASGITYAVAAGNSNADACGTSPARVPAAITVGATDKTDTRASFSNYGGCVDIFAPGVNITSTARTGDTATAVMSGTSMATPHVTGAAALLLAANPALTPQQVRDALVTGGVSGAVRSPGTGSPNVLLDVATPAPPAPPAPPSPPATSNPPASNPTTVVALRAHANGRFVSADSAGVAPLAATQTTVGQWEQFDEIDAGNGYVALRAHANGKFVSAENAGASPLVANRSTAGAWEQFQLVPDADGSTSLRAAANDRVVTADNAGASPLIANRSGIGAWEEFDVVDPATLTPSPVVSLLAHANGRYVSADNAGASPLIANRGTAGAWEQFDEVDAGGGYVALRSHANGRYVTADPGGTAPLVANRTVLGAWEKFQVVPHADGSVSLRAAANDRFVTAENGGASPLLANRYTAGLWEDFSLIS